MVMQTKSVAKGYLHFTTEGNVTTIRAQKNNGEKRDGFKTERAAKAWLSTYNGHKNWEHWNVALWLGNDEGLYRMALDYIADHKSSERAAERMLFSLEHSGISQTPDGAKYNKSNLAAAIRGLKD